MSVVLEAKDGETGVDEETWASGVEAYREEAIQAVNAAAAKGSLLVVLVGVRPAEEGSWVDVFPILDAAPDYVADALAAAAEKIRRMAD